MIKYVIAGVFMFLGIIATIAGTYAKGRLDQMKRDNRFMENYRRNEG